MSSRISRFTKLTHAQYHVLSQMPRDPTAPKLTWRANTLYALEKLGFIKRERALFVPLSYTDYLWSRTEKGESEINRLAGAKD